MKNNWRTDRRRLLGISMRALLALVVVGLLVVPVAVQADLKATAVVYAWDIVTEKFQNSNVIIPWDGTWIPFLHELNFDTDQWATPQGCDPGLTTQWAGDMFYGLANVDNSPLGAPGFQASRQWSLISCDRDGDGKFGPGDLTAPPSPYDRGTVYAECTSTGTYCYVDEATKKDVLTPCTTGNCQSEIVTTIQVNLDQDCDGAVDDALLGMGLTVDRNGAPELLCFYAEARTPTLAEQEGLPTWSIPLQARISTVGGDKTVNFALAPTAVDLAAFEATAQGNGVLLTWETASEIDNLGFNLYRSQAEGTLGERLNATLIPSKSPGQGGGAAYEFVDGTAAAKVTYYYTLEDVDFSGRRTAHGPIALTIWRFYFPLIGR